MRVERVVRVGWVPDGEEVVGAGHGLASEVRGRRGSPYVQGDPRGKRPATLQNSASKSRSAVSTIVEPKRPSTRPVRGHLLSSLVAVNLLVSHRCLLIATSSSPSPSRIASNSGGSGP